MTLFAQCLRFLNLTAEEAAGLFGVSRDAVVSWSIGRRTPKARVWFLMRERWQAIPKRVRSAIALVARYRGEEWAREAERVLRARPLKSDN